MADVNEDTLPLGVKGSGTKQVWRLLKMKNGGIFWPDIYMDGECLKVQEKHFENGFDQSIPLG